MDTFAHWLWAGAVANGLNAVRGREGTQRASASNGVNKRKGERSWQAFALTRCWTWRS